MKIKVTALSFILLINVSLYSQQRLSRLSATNEMIVLLASQVKLPDFNPPKPEPNRWTKGTFIQVGFSQVSLSNWAAGGFSSVSMNGYVNFYANYTYKKMYWENRVQVGYGFIHSFGDRYKKSDDKIIIDSKVASQAIDKLFMSAFINIRSQFSPGFTYSSTGAATMVSQFMAPGYLTLGVGMDYKPGPKFTMNLSPLTGNLVVVENSGLRTKYGNRADQAVKIELGAQLKADSKLQIEKNTTITNTLTLFSNFLGNMSHIKVNWEAMADAKINKFLSANIRTTLIYDHNILIPDSRGISVPRVQFKELLSLGFSYTFGNFKK
jgi:hypothetical protein